MENLLGGKERKRKHSLRSILNSIRIGGNARDIDGEKRLKDESNIALLIHLA